jgi:hypothetical protein
MLQEISKSKASLSALPPLSRLWTATLTSSHPTNFASRSTSCAQNTLPWKSSKKTCLRNAHVRVQLPWITTTKTTTTTTRAMSPSHLLPTDASAHEPVWKAQRRSISPKIEA